MGAAMRMKVVGATETLAATGKVAYMGALAGMHQHMALEVLIPLEAPATESVLADMLVLHVGTIGAGSAASFLFEINLRLVLLHLSIGKGRSTAGGIRVKNGCRTGHHARRREWLRLLLQTLGHRRHHSSTSRAAAVRILVRT